MKQLSGFLLLALIAACGHTPNADESLAEWKKRGDSLASRSFDTLRNTLLKAIGDSGFTGGIGFCRTQALPLTSAYHDSFTQIRRTSDRWRNPANKPDELEKTIIADFKKEWPRLKEQTRIMKDAESGLIHYFKPIVIQSLCLSCHGKPEEQVSTGVQERLREWYPGDNALYYGEGDFRGMWHIQFTERKQSR